jgi:hypothetical protein
MGFVITKKANLIVWRQVGGLTSKLDQFYELQKIKTKSSKIFAQDGSRFIRFGTNNYFTPIYHFLPYQ